MSLTDYHRKRNFKKTSEPSGTNKLPNSLKNLYVIQKHAASHLHYDFRLEMNGALKSWAVPKGPCLDPHVKRLAVHVEDHPLDYGSFEGTIPKGEYGGGTVMLWDTGKWENQNGAAEDAYRKGDLTFVLKGRRLKGLWKLIRLHNDPKNWLLMKIDDQYAKSENKYSITKAEKTSVKSKKTMDEIAQKTAHHQKKTINLNNFPAARKTKMPIVISPELATLVEKPPGTEQWLHETKFDGYRLMCHIKNHKIKLVTRGQHDWTKKFPDLMQTIKKLAFPDLIFDGEIVALNEQGFDFQLLQNTIHEDAQAQLVYYVFDLIYYKGHDLTSVSLIDRKKLLAQILPQDNFIIRYSDHIIGQGEQVFEQACKLSLEGIVSKRIDSTYIQKRTRDWLKIKCVKRQEFVVGGFTQLRGQRKYFGSLLLGVYKNNKLQYCGHVGTGFNENSLKEVFDLLQKQITQTMPFRQRPPKISNATWVKPVILVEVEFSEWTQDNVLRHPSFKGLRSDKNARSVGVEQPKVMEKIMHRSKDKKSSIILSNPERILYPKDHITKKELAEFYTGIQKWILPYIVNRPLTLLRCPQGMSKAKGCFYQKHLDKEGTKFLHAITITEKNGTADYIYIKDLNGLLSLVQLGVLEIHPWNCRIDKIENPDMIVFDLDPSPEVAWKQVVHTAHYLKELLESIDLKSFVKLTGGKGLHVVVPIKRLYQWDEIKEFSKSIVDTIVKMHPKDYIGKANKAERKGKIFIDYLRNQRGATSVAAYSTRANTDATVATPLSWDELTVKIKSNAYTIKSLPKRLSKLKSDPWQDFLKAHQTIHLKKSRH